LSVIPGVEAMGDSDHDEPLLRRRTMHTGAEFESGAVYRARGLNEPMRGVEPEDDGRLPEQEGWRGGHNNYSVESGRRRKLADTPAEKTILVAGKGSVKVFKGSSAVEDERWIYITEVKANGSKVYMCIACKPVFSFTGSEARVISHKLQLGDGTVKACSAKPSAECRLVLERVKNEKDRKRCSTRCLSRLPDCAACPHVLRL
jgi:hypothetical protein